jgi:glycosyltransferase involved in cell wall biosynthesis
VALLNAGLQRRGHDTLLVHGSLDAGEASLERLAYQHGIPVERHAYLGRRVSATSDLRAFVALLRTIFRVQPDVVHTHTAKAGALGRLAALVYNMTRRRSRRTLVVHTFHGHVFESYFSPALSRVVRIAERGLGLASDRIVTISPRQQHDIVERFRIAPSAKTLIVPLGLDLESLLTMPGLAVTLREDIGIAADDIVVGFAGRFVPIKDLPTLLRAFARAVAQVPHLSLVLAGDGPERETVMSLTRELDITGAVHLLGWVDDLPRFYATLDICVLSSLNEGTPVAAIEAMAAGVPVVATAVGGVPDVVEHDISGLLVAAGDVEALADALVQLATNPMVRARMGKAGRALARARYSHLRLVDDIEQIYRQALGQRRQPITT